MLACTRARPCLLTTITTTEAFVLDHQNSTVILNPLMVLNDLQRTLHVIYETKAVKNAYVVHIRSMNTPGPKVCPCQRPLKIFSALLVKLQIANFQTRFPPAKIIHFFKTVREEIE